MTNTDVFIGVFRAVVIGVTTVAAVIAVVVGGVYGWAFSRTPARRAEWFSFRRHRYFMDIVALAVVADAFAWAVPITTLTLGQLICRSYAAIGLAAPAAFASAWWHCRDPQ